ncbi:hypothetical protein 2050H1_170 [Serratia phage 2050H1]|uniref:Uncharacterized protein n=1 Tax=Serratia phage 2050H1 TaxID=2024250 RepID=A0A249Y2N6_9CAUD|nr:hypothetical protein 2050H1_170 [Serratia phage 2050H1]
MKTIVIQLDNKEGILAKLEPLRRKAEKYGLSFPTITFGEPYLKTVIVQPVSDMDGVTQVGSPVQRVYCVVEMHLEGEGIDTPISHGNFKIIGSFNHEYDRAVCNDFTGQVAPRYRERFAGKNQSHCEHCNKSLYRKNTYIVAGPEGEQLAVGSACMKTYVPLGRTVEEIVNFYGTVIEAFGGLEDSFQGGGMQYANTEAFLSAHVAAYLMKIGDPRAEVFQAMVYRIYNEPRKLERSEVEWLKENRQLISETVEAVIAYWKDYSPRNDFEEKLCIMVPSPHLRFRDLNTAKWGVYTYMKAKGIEAVEKAVEGIPDRNEYLVPVGEVLDIQEAVVVANKFLYSGDYSDTYLLMFKTQDGCTITWKTAYREIEVGEKLRVRGRCKAHVEFNGVKQTEITRASLYAIEA